MSTDLHNPHTINAVRAHPGRLLAGAGALAAAIACAVVLGQASGGGAIVSPDEPAAGPRPDPAILHHHGLNTVHPDPTARIRRQAERFHHR